MLIDSLLKVLPPLQYFRVSDSSIGHVTVHTTSAVPCWALSITQGFTLTMKTVKLLINLCGDKFSWIANFTWIHGDVNSWISLMINEYAFHKLLRILL